MEINTYNKTKFLNKAIAFLFIGYCFSNNIFGNPARAGIENLGATCFMNSSLQVLTNIEPLNNILDQVKNKNALTSVFYNLKNQILTEDKIINPIAFYDAAKDAGIETIKENIKTRREQDAQEFLTQFFDKINKETLNPFKFKQISTISTLQNELLVKNEEILLSVQLPLTQSNNNLKLNNLFDKYIEKETIDFGGGNAYKQLLFDTIPEILIISLKRFKFVSKEKTEKISTFVDLPLKLDLTQYLLTEAKSKIQATTYNLIGIINHIGESITNGHYIAYVKDYRDTSWYECNDRIIKPIKNNDIKETLQKNEKNSTPYIILYRREEMPFDFPKQEEKKEEKPKMTEKEAAAAEEKARAELLAKQKHVQEEAQKEQARIQAEIARQEQIMREQAAYQVRLKAEQDRLNRERAEQARQEQLRHQQAEKDAELAKQLQEEAYQAEKERLKKEVKKPEKAEEEKAINLSAQDKADLERHLAQAHNYLAAGKLKSAQNPYKQAINILKKYTNVGDITAVSENNIKECKKRAGLKN